MKNDDLNDFLIQLDERYEFILNNEEVSINYLDSYNYNFYVSINKYGYEELNEDSIKNFNTSFMEIMSHLLKYNSSDATDILYKSVIDFYKNGQYDDATILMNIIFNTNITSTTNSSNCGCNNKSVLHIAVTGASSKYLRYLKIQGQNYGKNLTFAFICENKHYTI